MATKDEISAEFQLNKSLIEACSKQDYMEVSSLLDAGADPNAVDDDNWESALTTLIFDGVFWENSSYGFVSQDFWRILNLLLKKGADVNLLLKTSDGEINTAMFSAQYSIPEVARFLLEHGANPDVVNDENKTVLDAVECSQFASHIGDGEWREDSDYYNQDAQIRDVLLEYGAHRASTLDLLEKMNKWDDEKKEIYWACWHLDCAAMKRAISKYQIDVSKAKYKELAYEIIHRSDEFRRKDFVHNFQEFENAINETLSVLLNNGYDVNADKVSALYFSVRNGYLSVTHFLLNHGAIPKKCDCSYTMVSASGKRHYFTLPEKVLAWRGRWTKETALKFQTLFPLPDQAQS